MNDNVVNLGAKKYYKDNSKLLDDFIESLKDLSNNPRLCQGLVPVLTAAATGLRAFQTNGKHWIPALRSSIRTGPDDRLEALQLDFHSDVAIEGDAGTAFMSLTADVGVEWKDSITKSLEGHSPTAPENVIPRINVFSKLDDEEIINNFAFIEFGIAATLRDMGFAQYVLVNQESKVTMIAARKGEVIVVQTIYSQTHLDDHLFLKNYGK